MKRLFVGGLAWETGDDDLRAAFAVHGRVEDVKVIMDRDTGRSKGFGFVTFESELAAENARQKMDGFDLGGRRIRVDIAQDKPRESRPPRREDPPDPVISRRPATGGGNPPRRR